MSNCKIGDLVRYVGKNELNRPNVYGWIGKVVGPSPCPSDLYGRVGLGWQVSPPLPGGEIIHPITGRCTIGAYVSDTSLKPIRGGEGQDEMLKLVGKPVKKEKPHVDTWLTCSPSKYFKEKESV